MKKIIYIGIVILSICVLITLILIYNYNFNIKKEIKLVSFNEEFTLKKGQTAKVINEEVTLKITKFVYNPCPEGAQCIWSGLDVKYELNIDGKKVNNEYESKYQVVIIDTDYKTYAKIKILKR